MHQRKALLSALYVEWQVLFLQLGAVGRAAQGHVKTNTNLAEQQAEPYALAQQPSATWREMSLGDLGRLHPSTHGLWGTPPELWDGISTVCSSSLDPEPHSLDFQPNDEEKMSWASTLDEKEARGPNPSVGLIPPCKLALQLLVLGGGIIGGVVAAVGLSPAVLHA
ncbi:hypothetical protein QIS74_04362 [Colletotrichum tabaci]|uniref:Uncharacterized protein n=1 Tax=Colletotrichum tabaci TaxID=1209068 RepID=A0AAV9TIF5_9PEZI